MDKKKKIVFEDLEVNYAKLKIRLRHDGLGQSDFFSFIVQKYIACDPQFLFFVDELKESRSKFGKRRQNGVSFSLFCCVENSASISSAALISESESI